MAGYIFTVSKELWKNVCKENISKGYFTPYIPIITTETKSKHKARCKTASAFFGDLITMNPGDNVYFLSNRRLYGIGKVVSIGSDCKYENYEGSSSLLPNSTYKPKRFLTTQDVSARWVFFFQPSPFFYKEGAEMDDVLRFRPSAFKMLRALEGLSFIKIDDEENRALKEYISLINEENYCSINENVFEFDDSIQLGFSLEDLSQYKMDINKTLKYEKNKDYVDSEMLIEAAILQQLSNEETSPIGHWDYLSQQVIASPFKPIKYIDRIDVFGYRYSKHYRDNPSLITEFLIIELKKEKVNKDTLKQIMQYVDWVCNEYASGDYSRIKAYIIGEDITRNLTADSIKDICQRSFIAKTHPAIPMKWNNVDILKYSICVDRFEFSPVLF